MGAVLLGAHAQEVAEVLAESRLGGEVQSVGHLLHRHLGVAQHHLGLEHDVLVDPVEGAFAAVALDGAGDVFGREKHLVGVELEAALLCVVGAQQFHETVEYLLGARLVALAVGHGASLVALHQCDDGVRKGYGQAVDDLGVAFLCARKRKSSCSCCRYSSERIIV